MHAAALQHRYRSHKRRDLSLSSVGDGCLAAVGERCSVVASVYIRYCRWRITLPTVYRLETVSITARIFVIGLYLLALYFICRPAFRAIIGENTRNQFYCISVQSIVYT